jgi:hypothetical protein
MLSTEDKTVSQSYLITSIDGDIRSEATFSAGLQGIDMVLHGAAALPLYPREDIFSTNII